MNQTDGKGEEGEAVKQDERLAFTQWRTLVLRQNTSPPVYPLTTGSEDSAKPTLFPLHNKTCLLWNLPSFQLPFQSAEIGFLGQTVILMVVFFAWVSGQTASDGRVAEEEEEEEEEVSCVRFKYHWIYSNETLPPFWFTSPLWFTNLNRKNKSCLNFIKHLN